MSRWPPASSYASILQIPRAAFPDPRLKTCQIRRNSHNQPLGISGRFAVVYQATLDTGERLAIRLFTSDREERTERYAAISAHLAQVDVPELVPFRFVEQGIRLDGSRLFPMVTMQWVAGATLYDWVQHHADHPDSTARIRLLADRWVAMLDHLREAQIAHGDLQHANILVTPDNQIKLVDYDCMCVPELAGRRNLEIGLAPYQHPGRDGRTVLSQQLDNFSALVIYVALRALAAEPALWERFVASQANDNLLFSTTDLEQPEHSALYNVLLRSPDPDVRRLTERLFAYYHRPFHETPELRSLLNGSTTYDDRQQTGRIRPGKGPESGRLMVQEADARLATHDGSGAAARGSSNRSHGTPAFDSRPSRELPADARGPLPPRPPQRRATEHVSRDDASAEGDPRSVSERRAAGQRVKEPLAPFTESDATGSPSSHVGNAPSHHDSPSAGEPGGNDASSWQDLLSAFETGDRTSVHSSFDARLIRDHQGQFANVREAIEDWVQQELVPLDKVGLAASRGGLNVAPLAQDPTSQRVRWTWPPARYAQCCILGLSREKLPPDTEPSKDKLTRHYQVSREDYEQSRGRVIHYSPELRGHYVYVWAVVDLGFSRVVSQPLSLGKLKISSAPPPRRGWKWWS